MKIKKIFTAGIFVASLFLPSLAFADVFGDFEYNINSDSVSVTITSYTGSDNSITIPEKINIGEVEYPVTQIGFAAFAGKSSITSVTLPNSITHIGIAAFAGTSLNHITIPSSVVSIDNQAFDSTHLTSVTIPDSVTFVGVAVFPNTVESLVIGSGIKEINQRIMPEYSNLTSLIFSEGLEKIGDAVFYGAPSLTSIIIPPTVTYLGHSAFGGSAITSIIIPDSVTFLGSMVFPDTLESITIGRGIKNIVGGFGFYPNIETINFSDELEIIEGGAFRGTRVTSIVIPDSVQKITGSAFSESKNLTSVDLGEGVREISYYAFGGTALTRVVIPESVTNLGDNSFADIDSLSEVYFKGNAPSTVGEDPFGLLYNETAPVITVYYYEGKTGFGSTWNGHNAVMLPKPTVVNLDVSSVETKTVKLNASLTSSDNSMNLTTKRGFQYGLTSEYGSSFEEESLGYSSGNFSVNLNNLQCGTTYHFRSYATNTAGTSYSGDSIFKTERCPTRVTGSRAINRVVTPVGPTIPETKPSKDEMQKKENEPSKHVPFVYKKIIKQGLMGDEVKNIQNYLLSKGYELGLVDGIFGPKTRQAVMTFQKNHGLKSDGIIGPITIQKINEIK